MIKSILLLITLPLLITNTVFATQASKNWEMTALSEKKLYTLKLECESAPTTGSFQDCWLTLKQSGKKIANAQVSMNGGMPEHHHGLPTAPVVTWSKQHNAHVIQGLKFSMPGRWVLNFSIEMKELPKDQATISIEIK